MGVKGLFKFLRRFEKDIHIPEYVAGKSVGIDIFWFLHKSKGDIFYLQNYLLPIIKNSGSVHCVFDGKPSQEKKQLLEEQRIKRKEILQSIEQIEKFLKYPFNHLNSADKQCIHEYLHQLRRQAWQPPSEYVDYVKIWLTNKGCHIHQAPEEADTFLIELEQSGIISIIVTNDSDLLTLGSSKVLRPVCPKRGALFDKKEIYTILGFTAQQWNDFMYICKNMKEKDILLAYSFISVYKNLEYVLQKYNTLYEDELIDE
jgi:5'-3' exonuclease